MISDLKQFMNAERSQRLDSVLEARAFSPQIVLENIHNPHNVSAVIRSADAFGLQHVHLLMDSFSYNKCVTMGSERWVTLHQHQSVTKLCAELRESGFKIVVLQPEGFQCRKTKLPSVPVFDLPFDTKLALVFGNEKKGVSAALAEQADIHAFIPMFGFVDSLNISVAAAITMFCSTVSGTARIREVIKLGEKERGELNDRWYRIGCNNSADILRELEKRQQEQILDEEQLEPNNV